MALGSRRESQEIRFCDVGEDFRMKLEDFENATIEQLRTSANFHFQAADLDVTNQLRHLSVARFWIDEIEKRENSRIAHRDYRMEWTVTIIIIFEIIVTIGLAAYGWHQESQDLTQQLAAFSKVQQGLDNLDNSSKDTAKILAGLKATTDTMNGAMQKQVALFYDVDINIIYSEGTKKLVLINDGRTKTAIVGARLGDEPIYKLDKPQIIPPGGSYEFTFDEVRDFVSKEVPKGGNKDYAMVFLVSNERNERFTIRGTLTALWRADTLSFNTHQNEVVPGWDKK
jgi:hypothetical protein